MTRESVQIHGVDDVLRSAMDSRRSGQQVTIHTRSRRTNAIHVSNVMLLKNWTIWPEKGHLITPPNQLDSPTATPDFDIRARISPRRERGLQRRLQFHQRDKMPLGCACLRWYERRASLVVQALIRPSAAVGQIPCICPHPSRVPVFLRRSRVALPART